MDDCFAYCLRFSKVAPRVTVQTQSIALDLPTVSSLQTSVREAPSASSSSSSSCCVTPVEPPSGCGRSSTDSAVIGGAPRVAVAGGPECSPRNPSSAGASFRALQNTSDVLVFHDRTVPSRCELLYRSCIKMHLTSVCSGGSSTVQAIAARDETFSVLNDQQRGAVTAPSGPLLIGECRHAIPKSQLREYSSCSCLPRFRKDAHTNVPHCPFAATRCVWILDEDNVSFGLGYFQAHRPRQCWQSHSRERLLTKCGNVLKQLLVGD